MVWVLVVAILCALFFFLKYLLTRRSLRQVAAQLEDHLKGSVETKLTVSLLDSSLEDLVQQINRLIDEQQRMAIHYHRAERAQREAIASMSHDLRTPLTAMIGYLQLLEQKDLSEVDRQKYLATVHSRAKRLEKLINNFFALSVIESAEERLIFERFSLKQVLEEELLAYYDAFQTENLEPILELSQNSVMVIGDRSCTKRVIENILLNVLQHYSMDPSGGSSTFHVQLKVDEQWAVLQVMNNHSEIAIDEQKVFNRFYTADSSRKIQGGLGLSIVRNLMEQMSGRVTVKVTADQFTIICRWKTSS